MTLFEIWAHICGVETQNLESRIQGPKHGINPANNLQPFLIV